VELVVKDGDSDAVGGGCVGVGSRAAFDEPVEAAQVVAHLPRAVVRAEDSATCPRRLLLVKPVTAWTTRQSAPARGHGALIPEAEGPGSLALTCVGLVDALKERRADGTALTGTFDHKQTVVDLAGLVHELGKMLEPGEDPRCRQAC
jgi:hypothetical protein